MTKMNSARYSVCTRLIVPVVVRRPCARGSCCIAARKSTQANDGRHEKLKQMLTCPQTTGFYCRSLKEVEKFELIETE